MLFLAATLVMAHGANDKQKELCPLKRAQMPPAQKGTGPSGLNLPEGWKECILPKPVGSKYSLTMDVESIDFDNIFTGQFQEVEWITVIGVEKPFTAGVKVHTFQAQHNPTTEQCRKSVAEAKAKGLDISDQLAGKVSVHLGAKDVQKCDSVHLLLFTKNGTKYVISKDLKTLALPFWDKNAMLLPGILFIVAFVLLLILICMLAMECRAQEVPQHPQHALEEGYYYDDGYRHEDEYHPPAVVRRVKGDSQRNSAMFAHSAGKMLGSMADLQGRVRALSGADPDEPQLGYDGELDQVMLMV
jgi:hypothetical protein